MASTTRFGIGPVAMEINSMCKTILGLMLAAAAVPALAQTPPAPPPGGSVRGGMLMRMDANRDGVVTRDEALADAGARFDRMDAHDDGRIDADEIARLRDMQGPRGDMPPRE